LLGKKKKRNVPTSLRSLAKGNRRKFRSVPAALGRGSFIGLKGRGREKAACSRMCENRKRLEESNQEPWEGKHLPVHAAGKKRRSRFKKKKIHHRIPEFEGRGPQKRGRQNISLNKKRKKKGCFGGGKKKRPSTSHSGGEGRGSGEMEDNAFDTDVKRGMFANARRRKRVQRGLHLKRPTRNCFSLKKTRHPDESTPTRQSQEKGRKSTYETPLFSERRNV